METAQTAQTAKAPVSKKSDVDSFIERKLNVLNAKGTGKASRSMARIIEKNKGGMN